LEEKKAGFLSRFPADVWANTIRYLKESSVPTRPSRELLRQRREAW